MENSQDIDLNAAPQPQPTNPPVHENQTNQSVIQNNFGTTPAENDTDQTLPLEMGDAITASILSEADGAGNSPTSSGGDLVVASEEVEAGEPARVVNSSNQTERPALVSIESIGLALLSNPTPESLVRSLQDLSDNLQKGVSPTQFLQLNPNACLLKVPFEIRQCIYDILLINPDLAHGRSVSKAEGNGETIQYGLSPRLLETCQQLYREGKVFLYERNTFYNVCMAGSSRDESVNLSPLTRFIQQDRNGLYPSIRDHVSYPLVAKWNVVYNTRKTDDSEDFPLSFLDFCQAIFNPKAVHLESKVGQLNLLLVQKMIEEGSEREEFWSIESAMQPACLLLRNLEFKISNAEIFEMPDNVPQDENFVQLYPANENWCPVEEAVMFGRVQSKEPAEAIYKMYPCLLRYAQSFENFPLFKMEMGFEERQDHEPGYLEEKFQDYFESGYDNPYRSDEMHPVEAALLGAKFSSDIERGADFKEARNTIIRFLEPQFQKVEKAALQMHELIKTEKKNYGLFDANDTDQNRRGANPEYVDEKLPIFIVLLEQYADAFAREQPFNIKCKIRPWRSFFKSLYMEQPTFAKVQKVITFYESSNNEEAVFRYFRESVSELDSLYLEMRAARANIFAWDFVGAFGCEIELVPSPTFELIDWSVNEPAATDEEEPSDNGDPDESEHGGNDENEQSNDGSEHDSGSDDEPHADGEEEEGGQDGESNDGSSASRGHHEDSPSDALSQGPIDRELGGLERQGDERSGADEDHDQAEGTVTLGTEVNERNRGHADIEAVEEQPGESVEGNINGGGDEINA